MFHRDFASLIAAALVLSGCASTNGTTGHVGPSPAQPPLQRSSNLLAADPSFVLGEGDEIEINVWRQDGLKRTAMIDTEGYISLPLAGQIRVGGMTVSETSAAIAGRLSKYFVDPQVDVRVSAIRSKRAHIFGEVSTPGTLVLDHSTSIWELVAKAGFTKDSNMERVVLIRNTGRLSKGSPEFMISTVNLHPGELDASSVSALTVQNGDVVYVPPLKVVGIERQMSRLATVIAPILGMESGILLIPAIVDLITGETVESQSGVIIGR